MDEVFRAIDDPSRRLLLDRLFVDDGQTLTQLCAHLPGMTRFGVMSHLRVLEDARLVSTRKVGRYKHHYLNPVPIRLVHDRWITKYTEAVAARVAGIKRTTEGARTMDKPDHVYRVFIAAPIEDVWRAITDGEMTRQYYYGTSVRSSWEVGAEIAYDAADGSVVATGEVLAFDPPHRLEHTFLARWDPELEKEGPVREEWVLAQTDGITTLSVELWGMDPASKTYAEFSGGNAYIVSALKTLLETGKPMVAA